MSKQKPLPPMGSALREARLDMRLTQAQLGALVGVSRESVHVWEHGKTIPPLDQRQRVLTALAGKWPAALVDRVARAWEIHVQRPASPPAVLAPAPPAPDPAVVRAAAVAALRAAADDLDVAPSIVRRTVAAIVRRMKEAGVPLHDIEHATHEEGTGGGTTRRLEGPNPAATASPSRAAR